MSHLMVKRFDPRPCPALAAAKRVIPVLRWNLQRVTARNMLLRQLGAPLTWKPHESCMAERDLVLGNLDDVQASWSNARMLTAKLLRATLKKAQKAAGLDPRIHRSWRETSFDKGACTLHACCMHLLP